MFIVLTVQPLLCRQTAKRAVNHPVPPSNERRGKTASRYGGFALECSTLLPSSLRE
jgi:hypothetical protein